MKLSIQRLAAFAFLCFAINNTIAQSISDSVAQKIDKLFSQWNNPNTPGLVADKFKDAITEVFNNISFNQENFIHHEQSPEYIEMILKGAGCSDE